MPRTAHRRPIFAHPALCALLGALGVLAAVLAVAPGAAWAHPGELDEYGGHFDEKTGTYHYHKPALDLASRKDEYLTWLAYPRKGVLKGTVARVDRPGAVWIAFDYRPAYQALSQHVSPSNRDDRDAQIRVWLKYVSPAESVNAGTEYNKWFKEKVTYELNRKLAGKTVSVQFEIPQAVARPRGMVYLGDENVNLWLVLNGWSYYVLEDEANPYDKLFVQAEELAQQNKVGLWARSD